MTDLLSRTLERIASAMIAICSVLFCGAVAALSVDIVLRWGFNSSITGLHEAIIITFLYGFLLGTAALYVRQGDVVLTFVIDRLGERAQRWLATAMQAIIGVTMSLVAYHTFVLALAWHQMHTPALSMPRSVELAPIFICAVVMAAAGFVRVIAPIQRPTVEQHTD